MRSLPQRIRIIDLRKGTVYNAVRMSKRLFILFLDGADHSFVAKALECGLAPTLASMRSRGCFRPLATSTPAESPVAFAEVLTGCNPGKHGIFDFLHRNPQTRMPQVSLYRHENGEYKNALACPTLFESLHKAGIKSAALRVPCTFPTPAGVDYALSGLGTPDVTETWGRFTAYRAAPRETADLFGTIEKKYLQGDDTYILPIGGPCDSSAHLEVRRKDGVYRCGADSFPPDRFSPWMRIEFDRGETGVVAVHADSASSPTFIVTPVWSHPNNPSLPAIHPHHFGRRLSDRYGLFPLSGWPEPNLVHAENRIGFEALHEMGLRTAGLLEAHAFDIFSDPTVDFVLLNYELFDRVAHAGIGDEAPEDVRSALTGALIRFDAFVSEVRKNFPEAEIIVASDHGFAPWKKRFNVNRWLAENGYLAADIDVKDPTLHTLTDEKLFWQGVEWNRSSAYAAGLSKIYLNLQGRESDGIVAPGLPAERLRKEITAKLLAERDPETGERIFSRVEDSRRIYWGQALSASGDLVLCYNAGYRTDWVSSLGGVGSPILSVNETPWQADHCGVDPERIPGILITQSPILSSAPCLRDIAPTACSFFGIAKPAGMDGDDLFRP